MNRWLVTAQLALLLSARAVAMQSDPTQDAGGASSRSTAAEDVDRVLLHAIGKPGDSKVVEQTLRALGSDAIEALIDVVSRASVSVALPSGQSREIPLPDALRATVVGALAHFPREDLLSQLHKCTAPPLDVARCTAAIDVLGGAGDQRDFALLQALLVPVDDGLQPRQREAFETALGSIVARSAAARDRLPELLAGIGDALAPSVIRAVERRPSAVSIEALARMLGARRDEDALVLLSILHVSTQLDACEPRPSLAVVRGYLMDPDAESSRLAAQIAAALDDGDAVDDLISLLCSSDPSIAAAARTSLRAITHRDFGSDSESWSLWYEREIEWWSSSAAACEERIAHGAASDAAAAILDLGRRSLFHDRSLRMLASAVERPEPQLLSLSCKVLAQLGDPDAKALLEPLLQHLDADVREAAHSALARIDPARRGRANDARTK